MGRRVVGALLASLIGIQAAFAQPNRPQRSARDSIVVVVRSDSGMPIADAVVQLAPAGVSFANGAGAITDTSGVARILRRKGSARVRVMRIGFVPATVEVHPGQREPIVVTLKTAIVHLERVCLGVVVPALRMVLDTPYLHDSLHVTIRARDGDAEFVHRTTIGAWSRGHVDLAAERPGTYDVMVRGPAIQEWRLNGVAVLKAPCHVSTQVVHVRLARSP